MLPQQNGIGISSIMDTLTDVPRLAKMKQTALDELDRPCPVASIDGQFIPNARIVLGQISGACSDSIAHVALALAEGNGELPTGYGAPLVRHFSKRSKQLEPILKVSIEPRFALIELAMLAGIKGHWTRPEPMRTQASHKQCSELVAQLQGTTGPDLEQWRRLIAFHRDSPRATALTHRNLAYALVWCGYFAPHEAEITDERLATLRFGAKREEFVRGRIESLRTLSELLAFSQQFPPRGPS